MPAFAKNYSPIPSPKPPKSTATPSSRPIQKTLTAVGLGEGNTSINASQNGAPAIAAGSRNTAANEAGVIGDK